MAKYSLACVGSTDVYESFNPISDLECEPNSSVEIRREENTHGFRFVVSCQLLQILSRVQYWEG